jgi:hypothetical protein
MSEKYFLFSEKNIDEGYKIIFCVAISLVICVVLSASDQALIFPENLNSRKK